MSDGYGRVLRTLATLLAIVLVLAPVIFPYVAQAGNRNLQLIQASAEGNLARVKTLLKSGADVNAKDKDSGYTALMEAAARGHLRVVQLLLDKGADINATDFNAWERTPLTLAAHRNHLKVMKLLIDRGADINARDNLAGSALLDASQEGNLEAVKLLLDSGADSRDGPAALMLAAQGDHLEVVQALRDSGIKLTLPVSAILGDTDGAQRAIKERASPNGWIGCFDFGRRARSPGDDTAALIQGGRCRQ